MGRELEERREEKLNQNVKYMKILTNKKRKKVLKPYKHIMSFGL